MCGIAKDRRADSVDRSQRTTKPSRSGLSLLEVILAIAVMASSMALLGELIRIGGRHATGAVNMTRAQIHCESIMGQVALAAIPAADVDGSPVMTDPEWLYSIKTSQTELQSLISVRVSVFHSEDTSINPRSASMTRLMIDPNLDLTVQAEDQEALDEAAQQ